jgi:outer membrane lipopolysaccharide assembly protein LptE/RlpB
MMLFARLMLGLATCGMHLHDRINLPRGEVWAHKTSLTLPFFIEISIPSQESHIFLCYKVAGNRV